MEKIEVIVSWSSDNYCAGTGAINGVVISTNKTFEGVKTEFVDAFKFHIASSLADGDNLPEYIQKGDYEFEFTLQVSALLHYFEGILTRSALARVTGINEKQLGHYATGYRNPRPAQRRKIIEGIHKIGKEFVSVV